MLKIFGVNRQVFCHRLCHDLYKCCLPLESSLTFLTLPTLIPFSSKDNCLFIRSKLKCSSMQYSGYLPEQLLDIWTQCMHEMSDQNGDLFRVTYIIIQTYFA